MKSLLAEPHSRYPVRNSGSTRLRGPLLQNKVRPFRGRHAASVAAIGILAWGAAAVVEAAPITWSSAVYPTNGSFLQNLDTGVIDKSAVANTLLAENVGGPSDEFDGISFAAGTINFGNTNPPGLHALGYHEGTGAGNTDLAKFGTYSGVEGASTVTLSGLTTGTSYRIQLLVFDGLRDGNATTRTVSVDGIDQGRYTFGVPGVSWGDGRIIKGIFVADADTQDFTIEIFQGDTSLGGQLNAIVVQEVAAPSAFFEVGPSASFLEAALSTDDFSVFRIGGATSDFANVVNPDGLSVVAGDEPTHEIDIVVEGPLTPGSYPLIGYSGTIGGLGFAGLELFQITSFGRPYDASLADTGTTIDLLITGGGPSALTWTGSENSVWDGDQTENWNLTDGGIPTTFFEGDVVRFDDSAPGGSPLTVTISGLIEPGSVVVDNETKDYTFEGDGISGPTSLVKSGAATVTLTSPNGHTGPTVIGGGRLVVAPGGSTGTGAITNDAVLEFANTDPLTVDPAISGGGVIEKTGAGNLLLSGNNIGFTGDVSHQSGTLLSGNANSLGAGPGIVTVADGATLDVNAIGFGGKPVHVQGSGVGGQGAIINHGGLLLGGVNDLTLIGDTTIGGTGRWDVRGDNTTVQGDHTLTKVGTNEIGFVWGLYTVRDIVITAGRLSVEYGAVLDNSSPGMVTITGGSLGVGDYGLAISLSKPITLNGGSIGTTTGSFLGNATIAAPVTLGAVANPVVVLPGATIRLEETVSGSGALLMPMTGGGTLVLASPPAYTGNTYVDLGTLVLEQPGLDDASTVTLGAGGVLQLDFAGSDTVAALTIDGVNQPDGPYDASHPSGRFVGTGTLLVGSGEPGGYAAWAAGFPGLTDTDPSVDFDNDGLATGIEYVVGGDPTASDAAGLAPIFDNTSDPEKFLFIYRLSDLAKADPGVTVAVQYGSNLTGWSTAAHDPGGTGVTITVLDVPDEDYDLVTVSIPKALSPGSLFARLVANFQ